MLQSETVGRKTTPLMSRRLKGVPAAPGIAIAPLVHFHLDLDFIPTRAIAADEVDDEVGRLEEAIASAAQGITLLRHQMAKDLSVQDTRIYDAQLSLLHDPTFKKDLLGEIRTGLVNSEVALQRVVARLERAFENLPDAAMRERAADVRDVGRQLLGTLLERTRSVYISGGRDYVFAADEFLPSDVGLLDRQHIRGIVTARGGKYSHGAILARSLGIPAVVAIEDVLLKAPSGTVAVVDGESGSVVLEPSEEDLERYRGLIADRVVLQRKLSEVGQLSAVTRDGVAVSLQANVESVRDLDQLEIETVSGIGLFRTEFAFMERRQFPTEEEQVAMYRRAMEGAKGKPVTFRTLDVGGDKPLGYFRMPEERNPVLGWRGVRLTLDWPDILYTQMRAILRASALGHARILLPMVTTRSEIVRCREVLQQLTEDLRANAVPHDREIELGVMVEVPVLVSVLPDLLPLVDFVSVGSNDLVQYLLAVDRDNQRVAKMYDPFHPGVLRVLEQIAIASTAAGKSVSICGEIAGDHWFTPLLVGMGYRELSMAPVFLPRVKLMLRSFTLDECRDLARRAIARPSTALVRKLVQEEIQVRWTRQLGAAEERRS